jgi:hypothetical protein
MTASDITTIDDPHPAAVHDVRVRSVSRIGRSSEIIIESLDGKHQQQIVLTYGETCELIRCLLHAIHKE